MDSILQKGKQCFFCHTEQGLHCHHVYGASNRNNSEEHGFKVWLCSKHHNMGGRDCVHGNRSLDLYLKRRCQEEYEKSHSRAEFMQIIGRNYL